MSDTAGRLDRVRKAAGFDIKFLCSSLLSVSRPTYYAWINGATISEDRKKRVDMTMKILAVGLKQGVFPVEQKGKEKRTAQADAIRSIIQTLSK